MSYRAIASGSALAEYLSEETLKELEREKDKDKGKENG